VVHFFIGPWMYIGICIYRNSYREQAGFVGAEREAGVEYFGYYNHH